MFLTPFPDSTCGNYPGDLVKKVDNMGNVVCQQVDYLHRVTAITYSSGPYASVTPLKHFVYDGATVNGGAMANAKGRLAEAYTCTPITCAALLTDLGFSYSPRGEVNNALELTPASG